MKKMVTKTKFKAVDVPDLPSLPRVWSESEPVAAAEPDGDGTLKQLEVTLTSTERDGNALTARNELSEAEAALRDAERLYKQGGSSDCYCAFFCISIHLVLLIFAHTV